MDFSTLCCCPGLMHRILRIRRASRVQATRNRMLNNGENSPIQKPSEVSNEETETPQQSANHVQIFDNLEHQSAVINSNTGERISPELGHESEESEYSTCQMKTENDVDLEIESINPYSIQEISNEESQKPEVAPVKNTPSDPAKVENTFSCTTPEKDQCDATATEERKAQTLANQQDAELYNQRIRYFLFTCLVDICVVALALYLYYYLYLD